MQEVWKPEGAPPLQNLWKDVRPPLVTSLVTTFDLEGRVNASPKSWWTPTSYDPPLLMLSCKPETDTVRNIDGNGLFVLHVPPAGPRNLVTKILHTAKRLPYGENELDDVGLRWRWIEHPESKGLLFPAVDGIPYFACMVVSRLEAGDHVVFEGRVVMAAVGPDGEVDSVLLHRGQNTFVDIGSEWKAERY